jgi:hypothetical protein
VIVQLNHDEWCQVHACFSDAAFVCRIQVISDPVSIEVNVPLARFTWPVPAAGYTAWVQEPEPGVLGARLEVAGLELPTLVDLPGMDMVPDKELSLFPGSTTPYQCPSCPDPQPLVIGRPADLRHCAEIRAGQIGVSSSCIQEGSSMLLGGLSVILVQCTRCVSRYLVGPATQGRLVVVEMEESH